MLIQYVNEHVSVKNILRLAYHTYLRQIVSNQGWILIVMFSFREVGQKICHHRDILFGLPVGYFHAADCFLIGKFNLEPGLELIVLRVKVPWVIPDYPV
jgi:hypothetical protein